MGPLNRGEELQALAKMAMIGDPEALVRLQGELSEQEYDHVLEACGDLTAQVRSTQIEAISGDDLLQKQGLDKRVERLRTDLAGPDPSPPEMMLADVICACWLDWHEAHLRESQLGDVTFTEGEYHQRRHDRALRRLLSAVRELARVRRLLGLPSIQVNVAERQVNVIDSCFECGSDRRRVCGPQARSPFSAEPQSGDPDPRRTRFLGEA